MGEKKQKKKNWIVFWKKSEVKRINTEGLSFNQGNILKILNQKPQFSWSSVQNQERPCHVVSG